MSITIYQSPGLAAARAVLKAITAIRLGGARPTHLAVPSTVYACLSALNSHTPCMFYSRSGGDLFRGVLIDRVRVMPQQEYDRYLFMRRARRAVARLARQATTS